MTKYFTFNKSIQDGYNLDEVVGEYTWHVWEQIQPGGGQRNVNYEENTRDLASFDTVQKFWKLWSHMPQPSELLENKRMVRRDEQGNCHVVDALMIFKTGIKPMWEDPENSQGGHFEYRLSPSMLEPGQFDEYWNNLVLGLVGATIENIDYITGVRLVDKLSQGRNACIRIEVWCRKTEKPVREALSRELDKCFATKLDGTVGKPPRSGDYKAHSC